ncbi:DedA family protein [Alkalinema pantanalense CENA528]|uniref:DedA family protein n=1 Tax=Alkalinema pantanalense TaxID=1620705 RepID=UPI003D6E39C4
MAEWIKNTMEALGYGGIALLMFLENIFPPIPSELIMPLAGFTAHQGQLNVQYVVLAGVLGTMVGTLPWYYAGKILGEPRLRRLADRYGKWLGMSGEDIDRANRWFYRHGNITVLICRLVPGVRTVISLPAGISEMPIGSFMFYSTVGTTLWVSLLTYAGYILGSNYERVDEYLAPVSKIVLVGLLLAFGIWLWRKQNIQKQK